MYFVELTDGRILTGASIVWADLVKMLADGIVKIKELGLTDMYHIRESITGADAYYYFTDGEAGAHHRVVKGAIVSSLIPHKVIGEEIAGFYSAESSRKIFEKNIQAANDLIVATENRLSELRATTITSEEIQNSVNDEIKQKQGAVDQTKFRLDHLKEEFQSVMTAGGMIVSKRINITVEKFPADLKDESLSSRIQLQDPQYWIGQKGV